MLSNEELAAADVEEKEVEDGEDDEKEEKEEEEEEEEKEDEEDKEGEDREDESAGVQLDDCKDSGFGVRVLSGRSKNE